MAQKHLFIAISFYCNIVCQKVMCELGLMHINRTPIETILNLNCIINHNFEHFFQVTKNCPFKLNTDLVLRSLFGCLNLLHFHQHEFFDHNFDIVSGNVFQIKSKSISTNNDNDGFNGCGFILTLHWNCTRL